MKQSIVGLRIREHRRALGLTQAELARRVGISPSYMNLIERNRRGIAGALLRRVADTLGLPVEELSGVAEQRLLLELEEVARIPEIESLGAEAQSVGEFIGRFPGWAKACAALFRLERQSAQTTRALAERITHDPFLGDTVHAMLTQITALRAAAEILDRYDTLDEVQRNRFLAVIGEQSVRLTGIGESLVNFLEKGDVTERVLTPLDEVEAMFETNGNRFDEIEEAAETLAPTLALQVQRSKLEVAREVVEAQLAGLISRRVAAEPRITTLLAEQHASEALAEYAAAAILVPMSRFAPRAAELRYDIEALAQSFSVGGGTICLRLIALQHGSGVPRFGYLKANASGTIVLSRSLPDLGAPRYASACPLWVLFRAQQSPHAVIRQRAVFPTGARFVFVARARNTGMSGFGSPRHYITDMLAMSEEDADLTVYKPDPYARLEPVGTACRSCPRHDCAHRVIDPLAG
ncbi:MAG: short-chain fatty acyl-CoA regulator family protein [Gammaproteobacteria bacterium]|nr:short-chain fatty acyl-CoA regulator family protein [Gammaproteobacteria bacterium]